MKYFEELKIKFEIFIKITNIFNSYSLTKKNSKYY